MGLGAIVLAIGSMLGSASIANAATFTWTITKTTETIVASGNGPFTIPDPIVQGQDYTLFEFITNNVVVETTTSQGSLEYDPATQTIVQLPDQSSSITGDYLASTTEVFIWDSDLMTWLSQGQQSTFDTITTTTSEGPFYTATPEPTSIITLIGLGVLGVASKKLKKKA